MELQPYEGEAAHHPQVVPASGLPQHELAVPIPMDGSTAARGRRAGKELKGSTLLHQEEKDLLFDLLIRKK